MQFGGDHTSIQIADIELTYATGDTYVVVIDYRPDGVNYETLAAEIRLINKRLGKN